MTMRAGNGIWRWVTATFFLIAGTAVCASSYAASAPKAAQARYGGTLRMAEWTDGASIGFPAKMGRVVTSMRQASPAVETLFRNDVTGNIVPWLATGFKNNVAARTITLALRKGVKFHDGTDFNAAAVKWNLEQCMAARAPGTEKFKSLEAVDDNTLRINLTEWDSTVTSQLSQPLGMMISPTACQKNGEEWAANHPVGTGPFQFVSWERDVRTTYRKFDGYWQKGKPYVDRIEWSPVPDSLTRQLSFRRGEFDLLLSPAAKDLAGLEKDGFVVERKRQGGGAYGVIPDSANPKSPFADVRVRRAAQHAIDAPQLVKSVLYGEAEPANQWGYKGNWGYNPAVAGYPYNPAKARQLLAEAGFPNGFRTRLLYRTSPENDQIFTAVQGYLKAVGIDAELEPVQSGRYDEIAFRGGKWEGLIHNTLAPNPDVTTTLASRYAGGGKFFTQMLVPEDYAKAIQSAIGAADFKTKQKWVREAMKLMTDKYCLQVVIYTPYDFIVGRPTVHNHGVSGTPNNGLWTPEEVWLEK